MTQETNDMARDFSRFNDFLYYNPGMIESNVISAFHGKYIRAALLFETPTRLCAIASRLSHESWMRSTEESDVDLLYRLEAQGDEHAKAMRGKQYYIAIEAPRYWWAEMDTYRIGTQPMGSTSTMFKEARRLSGDDLVRVKSELKEGTLQLRVWMMSYQAIRRIWAQRAKHRLPEWREIVPWLDEITQLKKA